MPVFFDLNDLVKSFVEHRRQHYQPELQDYHSRRFAAMQSAFGVTLSLDAILDFRKKALWFEFNVRADSYMGLTEPSRILEGGLIEVQIKQLGETGDHINTLRFKLFEMLEEVESHHLALLRLLLVAIWVPTREIVSTDDLKIFGFDPLELPPQFED